MSSRKPCLTASISLVWPVLGALRRAGVDVAAVLAEVGLDSEIAFSLDARVPLEQVFDTWRAAIARTGNPALGIYVAGATDPASTVSWPMPLSLFEHLGMVCSTLADAAIVESRYLRLLRDGLRTELELDGDRAILRFEQLQEGPVALTEYLLAISVNVIRRIAKREPPIQEVWFAHAAPAKLDAYAKLFKAPCRFEAPCNALIFRAEDFKQPLPTANERIRSHLVRHAESLLAALPTVDLFEDKVCAQIRAELPAGNTNASAIAEKLGVSSRTLHRRLQQEETSYQELLDAVRLRLSLRHLDMGKSITEVALLVGFAQASTFHRAFKHWTGETPADYQLRNRAPEDAPVGLNDTPAKAGAA